MSKKAQSQSRRWASQCYLFYDYGNMLFDDKPILWLGATPLVMIFARSNSFSAPICSAPDSGQVGPYLLSNVLHAIFVCLQ